jgi:mannosyltransferase OCH1-like enzyme
MSTASDYSSCGEKLSVSLAEKRILIGTADGCVVRLRRIVVSDKMKLMCCARSNNGEFELRGIKTERVSYVREYILLSLRSDTNVKSIRIRCKGQGETQRTCFLSNFFLVASHYSETAVAAALTLLAHILSRSLSVHYNYEEDFQQATTFSESRAALQQTHIWNGTYSNRIILFGRHAMGSPATIYYITKRFYNMRTCRRSYVVLSCISLLIVLVYLTKHQPFQPEPVAQEQIPAHIIQKSPTKLSNYKTSSFFRLNPNHTYYSFGDKEADEFIQKHMPSNVVQVYMSMPKAILKADLFKVIAVMVLGGVYSDKDTECLRPIDTWTDGQHKHVGFIAGLEWANPTRWKERFARPIQLCMWTFAGVPDHPILRNVVKKIVAISPQMHAQNMSYNLVMNWTGPGMWTDVILDYLHDHHKVDISKLLSNITHPVLIGDVYILPLYAFAPYLSSKGNQDPEARVAHYFEGSWKKDKDMIQKSSK